MNSNYKVSRNQMMALCTVSFLSPTLRLFPANSATLAGRAAWLAAPAALPLMLGYIYLLSKLMDAAGEDEGLAELCLRIMGKKTGTVIVCIFVLWYLIYGAFVLRTGADRLITTVYPYTSPKFFVISMGLLCLFAALCPLRSVLRTAKLVMPMVLGFLFLMLIFALFSVDRSNILPLSLYDIIPVFKASFSALNVTVGVLYTLSFLGGMVKKGERRFRSYGRWICYATILMTLLNLCIIGCFGPKLTSGLARPFFSLVRSLVFFNSIERLEAFLVTLWIFPDFLLVALVLCASQHCLRLILGCDLSGAPPKLRSLRNGRWIIWLCSLAVIILGLIIAPDTSSLDLWSKKIVPYANLFFAFLVIPSIYIYGRLSKRIKKES